MGSDGQREAPICWGGWKGRSRRFGRPGLFSQPLPPQSGDESWSQGSPVASHRCSPWPTIRRRLHKPRVCPPPCTPASQPLCWSGGDHGRGRSRQWGRCPGSTAPVKPPSMQDCQLSPQLGPHSPEQPSLQGPNSPLQKRRADYFNGEKALRAEISAGCEYASWQGPAEPLMRLAYQRLSDALRGSGAEKRKERGFSSDLSRPFALFDLSHVFIRNVTERLAWPD